MNSEVDENKIQDIGQGVEEELDSFILAEKNANDEIMKNPFQNPIQEIFSLKTKGKIKIILYYSS